MKYWIKKISKLISMAVFFLVLFNGIPLDDPFNLNLIYPTLIKAFIGATIFWVAGFIISDIVLKGIVEDIPNEELDLLDGGIIQRMKQYGNEDKFHSIADEAKNELSENDDKKKKK